MTRHTVVDALDLTAGQQGMWLKEQLSRTPVLHVPWSLPLHRDAAERLPSALEQIAAAQPALRARLDGADGAYPRLVVEPGPAVAVTSASGPPPGAVASAEALAPFPDGGPLWRAVLHAGHGPGGPGGNGALAEFAFSHLVWDEDSADVFFGALAGLLRPGGQHTVPPGAYGALHRRQHEADRRALASPQRLRAAATWYWSEHEVVHAPAPPPSGERVQPRAFTSPGVTREAVAGSAAAASATPFVAVLTALLRSWARAGDRRRFLVGIPVSRRRPEDLHTVGYCVNIVPFDGCGDPRRPFGEDAAANQQAWRKALARAHLPFELLLAHAEDRPAARGEALLDLVVAFVQRDTGPEDHPGAGGPRLLSTGIPRFPVCLGVTLGPRGVVGHVEAEEASRATVPEDLGGLLDELPHQARTGG